MTIGQLILWIFIGTPEERQHWKTKAKTFCEKHLVADDPYDDDSDGDDGKEK